MPNFDSNESEDCSNCTIYGPCDRHREPDRVIDTRFQETEEEIMARYGYAYVNGKVKFVGKTLNIPPVKEPKPECPHCDRGNIGGFDLLEMCPCPFCMFDD